jgi:CHAT domain-containing protein
MRAILDIRGARNEMRSLAAGMIQAGARAVLAALWSVDDQSTYLLMVRFAREWLPRMEQEPPTAALARA